jgi:hypothetical protein
MPKNADRSLLRLSIWIGEIAARNSRLVGVSVVNADHAASRDQLHSGFEGLNFPISLGFSAGVMTT